MKWGHDRDTIPEKRGIPQYVLGTQEEYEEVC